MRELWFVAPRKVEIRESDLRAPAEGEIVASGIASCVSQGTELLLYRGEGPERFDPSIGEDGPTYPRRYGYSWVGETDEGTRVFALAPHADAHVLKADDARPLPTDLPAPRATLAANLETAVTCVWDSEIGLGDRALVLGGGVVGILVSWLLVRAGARVTLVEPRRARREAARALVPALGVGLGDVAEGSVDIVVEATGDPRALDTAITACAAGGRILVASFYGTRHAPLDLGDRFHRARLELRASQVSTIPARLGARWDAARRFGLVVDLLGEPALDHLLAPPVPFARAAQLYASLDGNADVPPAHVFVYR